MYVPAFSESYTTSEYALTMLMIFEIIKMSGDLPGNAERPGVWDAVPEHRKDGTSNPIQEVS